MTTFLATLADTCNVVRSARAAGFSANWAYCKRKTDASFRAGWRIAVREGYAKLELILLDRAMNGTVRRVPTQDGGERRIREYSNNLAIALLRRHAEAADDDIVPPDEVKDARDRILARLVGLKRAARAAQRDGAADETA
jgi:hypothetical protein